MCVREGVGAGGRACARRVLPGDLEVRVRVGVAVGEVVGRGLVVELEDEGEHVGVAVPGAAVVEGVARRRSLRARAGRSFGGAAWWQAGARSDRAQGSWRRPMHEGWSRARSRAKSNEWGVWRLTPTCQVGREVHLTKGVIPSRYRDLPFEKFVTLNVTT